MKKFNSKFIASVLMAGIIAVSASVSASAIVVDYTGAGEPDTSAPSTIVTRGGKVSGISADAPTPVIAPDTVKEAIKGAADGKATIYATESKNGKITITEAGMAEIANGDTIVEVVVESTTGIDYTVIIDPDDIDTVKAINIAMVVEITNEGTTINGVAVPAGSLIIKTGMKYDYGCTLKIYLNKNHVEALAKEDAKLYSISGEGSVAKDITEELTVGGDGSVTVTVSHGATLIITTEELGEADASYEAAAVEEAGVEDAKSDNAPVVIFGDNDMNPGTGVGLALGALALSAAAVAVTKKRK